MYYAIVATLMFAFPLVAVGFEASQANNTLTAVLVAKWFAFWSVGWRLFLAGTRQVLQPSYTAKVILGFKGEEALLLVRELGFANLALGVVGIASLFVASWQLAVALAGGIFVSGQSTTPMRRPESADQAGSSAMRQGSSASKSSTVLARGSAMSKAFR
ncbi:MAG TPA: DUF6790 family protein [Burkholderiaceae bacterium]|nr:DUF6790 family protein [Burkholderiaceae bacterium]